MTTGNDELTPLINDLLRLKGKHGVSRENAHASKELQRLALQAAEIDSFPPKEHQWLIEQFICTVSDHDPSRAVQVARDLFALSPEDPSELCKLLGKTDVRVLKTIAAREQIAGRHDRVNARRLRSKIKPEILPGCASAYINFATTESEGREVWRQSVREKLRSLRGSSDKSVPLSDNAESTTGFGHVLAKSAESRRGLRARKVQDEVRRDIVDGRIVSQLLLAEIPSIIPIRGDAGAGKTTIAGQVYDTLLERKITSVIFVPCQWLNSLPSTIDEFDIALGGMVSASSGLIDVVRSFREGRSGPVIIVLDTIDNVLSQSTYRAIIELFRRIVQTGASIIFTCRPREYDNWIKPHSGQFILAFRDPVEVPRLSKEEVARLVAGYLAIHPPETIMNEQDFVNEIWTKAQARTPMQRIVTNPYFLLMLCETFAPRGEVSPDLTTTGLCKLYVEEKINTSRRHLGDKVVSKAKRRVLHKVAGELWNRSRRHIALKLPQSWLDENVDDDVALEDLLSEEVLIRTTLDPTAVEFNHQFLAEFLIALYLRDVNDDILTGLLAELKDAPEDRWFTWQFVRHVLATSLDEDSVKSLLEQMDLTDAYAYQTAAQGLVEQPYRGYLSKLAEHVRHYSSLLKLQVLFFVPDERLDEAFNVLNAVMCKGTREEISQASAVAGRLATRIAGGAQKDMTSFKALFDTVAEIRKGKIAAEVSHLKSFPDDLIKNLLNPSADRGISFPKDVLLHTHMLVSEGKPGCFRSVIHAHLVEGVDLEVRWKLLEKLLDYKHPNRDRVADKAIELIACSVHWNVETSAVSTLDHQLEMPNQESLQRKTQEISWINVKPIDFLKAGGDSSGKLRAAALAFMANRDEALRTSVVQLFVIPSDSETTNRALICMQEIVRAGGQQWLLAKLQELIAHTNRTVASRLSALVKTLEPAERSVRHTWATWFKSYVAEKQYRTVDAYLQIGWDHPDHLKFAIEKLKLLPANHRKAILTHLVTHPAPGKSEAVDSILNAVNFDLDLPLLIQIADITGKQVPDSLIDGLVHRVASKSEKVSKGAITKLKQAACDGRSWMQPRLLERYAADENPRVRLGVLKIIEHLVKDHVGDVDKTVEQWVAAANERGNKPQSDLKGEQTYLIKICHSYLRNNFGTADKTIVVIKNFVEQLIATLDEESEIRRELLTLIKTVSYRDDKHTRAQAAKWIFDMFDKVDIKNVRDGGEDFTKEILDKLFKRDDISFEDISSRLNCWKKGTLEIIIDFIVSHAESKYYKALFDKVLQANEGESVRSYLTTYHTRGNI